MTGLIDMTASAALTGLRVAVADAVDDAAVTAMRDAGAVVFTGVSARPAQVVADGDADIAVTADAPPTAVCITPTAAALRTRLSVVASDLAVADAAMTVLAAHSPGRWPADVRFAAPPELVIGVALDARTLGAVTAALSRTGARVVDGDFGAREHLTVPDGVDAVITAPGPGLPRDLCSVTVRVDGSVVSVVARAFDDAVAVDIAASLTNMQEMQRVWPLGTADPVELVVFGAHLRGGPLTHQLTDLGGRWAGETTTAPRYRMTVLPTVPPKPAITRVPDDLPGTALYGHRWLLSAAALGRFLAALPAPMQLGKVEFDDGSWRTAFGCEAAAATGADISRYGSWPGAVAAGAVRGGAAG
ncbi:hypothetical protein H7I57_11605 [Mycobacterium pyrenivorans]|nr:hypothetical protein [Mycolicibacterium pyrenivorans]